MTITDPLSRSLVSLRGLALGDALGSQFFVPDNRPYLDEHRPPPGPWQWTDDTEMACSVVAVLAEHGRIDQDALAEGFAVRHDFDRGYGPSTNRLLRLVREGGSWRDLVTAAFDGRGSWGNGAAMRIPPLGAWYAGDPRRAAREAARSAEVTHAHPEGIAGAVAVAVAASLVADTGQTDPADLISAVLELTPLGQVHDGIAAARELLTVDSADVVARQLGNGSRTSAQDTVPFALWAALTRRDDFRTAFWTTASVGGDVDTTCAIVGGIVAAGGAEPPRSWSECREPLPDWSPDDVET
ncbi:ADP-ribosylglycohydrolase [Actinoalloteichus hoggarensis]|uniref:ADP-ribosyl-[dinitrogen reductase] glycohydrolase n=1 Tax=Actinoalloteichus hoggarensis TaxID=1470176 RepID=A0A221W371_9PSEU|nr:ADP-ribosylglycohydrolase family protein [Actinoalloteichus hoggarensis]ASO20174.1 ADP-ribosyl-[dinitrogen reductase] glycohydrolase [Actinoalloteichus hoggarensis]MBB5919113.1 ADP-ribosylglycohydrolase [Actinoalloteichus hoggarensis]